MGTLWGKGLRVKHAHPGRGIALIIRGVSDVGFPIFADTDADFAFQYLRISDTDADILYFIILGLWKWVSATDDEENSENYAIIKFMNEWKCNKWTKH